MRASLRLAIAATLPGFAAGAGAQSGERWSDNCNDVTGQRSRPDERVAGCTTLIESDMLTSRNLASALHNRGLAYRAQGDLHRAIADFRRALRLAPNHPGARASLCEAMAAAGQSDPACPAS